MGGVRPLKKFTLPNGAPVYIVAAKVTGVTRAIPHQHHPNAHAIIVSREGQTQVQETREAISEALAREDLKTGNLSGYTTPVSATTQASPPVVDYTGLFLGMSFQGLQLTGNVRPYNTGGGWVDIIGTDNVYGMTLPRYPASPWGGTATNQESLQLIYNSPTDQSRQLVTDTTVPLGVSNKAIQFTFHNPYVAPAQESFQVFPDQSKPQGMGYFSKWMWLQPDLPSRGTFWIQTEETKTNGASLGGGNNTERFGVAINQASWTDNVPKWNIFHDAWNHLVYQGYAGSLLSPSASVSPMVSGQTYYAPVPLGQWFRIESAWNRDMNGTGWFWMALTVPESSDPNLRQGVQVFAQSGAITQTWGGVTTNIGWNKLTNEPINRVFPFAAYSDIYRTPTSPYSIRATNIEFWTRWPSTASPHPSNFN